MADSSVTKEVRDSLSVFTLPGYETAMEEFAYNEACSELIKNELKSLGDGAMLRTHYPGETADSEDVVSLNEDGEIVILDSGTS